MQVLPKLSPVPANKPEPIKFISIGNFEDIEMIYKQINELYTELSNENFRESDIVIDITSGQKVNSIAGAVATLGTDRQFQYISTETKKVTTYDVEIGKDDKSNK